MVLPPFSVAVHYDMGHELENGLAGRRTRMDSRVAAPPPNYPRPAVNSTAAGRFLFHRKFPKNRALAAFLSPASGCLQRRFFHAIFALSETLILAFVSVVEVT